MLIAKQTSLLQHYIKILSSAFFMKRIPSSNSDWGICETCSSNPPWKTLCNFCLSSRDAYFITMLEENRFTLEYKIRNWITTFVNKYIDPKRSQRYYGYTKKKEG
jgi:hypothetical protein